MQKVYSRTRKDGSGDPLLVIDPIDPRSSQNDGYKYTLQTVVPETTEFYDLLRERLIAHIKANGYEGLTRGDLAWMLALTKRDAEKRKPDEPTFFGAVVKDQGYSYQRVNGLPDSNRPWRREQPNMDEAHFCAWSTFSKDVEIVWAGRES